MFRFCLTERERNLQPSKAFDPAVMLGLGLGLGLRPQNVGLGLEAIGLDYIVVIVKLLRTVAYVSILRSTISTACHLAPV